MRCVRAKPNNPADGDKCLKKKLVALALEHRHGTGDPVFGGAGCDGEHRQAAVLELLQPELVEVLRRPVFAVDAKIGESMEWDGKENIINM